MSHRIVDTLTETQATELCQLFQNEFWSQGRTLAEVKNMLANSDILIAVLDSNDKLLGFARVLTDFTFKAILFDLVVAPATRKHGIGQLIMDTLINHPALSRVKHIDLQCLPQMFPFYQRWNFTNDLAGIHCMRRFHNQADQQNPD